MKTRLATHERSQQDEESIDQFVAALRGLAVTCKFEQMSYDQVLRNQILMKTKSRKIQEKLWLCGSDLSLNHAIDVARTMEDRLAGLPTCDLCIDGVVVTTMIDSCAWLPIQDAHEDVECDVAYTYADVISGSEMNCETEQTVLTEQVREREMMKDNEMQLIKKIYK
ncbi:hypothetical protein NDU88_007127 [Pleurodeles waltl]|uniref:Uncharacterized protein n=1 Tax=Pleurodeles waltl TaxID=8319 RepID=A0AAV7P1B0_PLEWA|nr:hypothetical protein NDU88_007127 [Pleurodeles waltl]